MAGHFDDRLVEFLQHQRDRVQHVVEAGVDVRAVGLEGDVPGHVQDDVVAVARDADAAVLQLRAELRLLAVHVVADRAAGKSPGHAQLDGTPLALAGAVADDQADDGASGGADSGALGGLADFLVTGVGVVGHASSHQRAGKDHECGGSQELAAEHWYSFVELSGRWSFYGRPDCRKTCRPVLNEV